MISQTRESENRSGLLVRVPTDYDHYQPIILNLRASYIYSIDDPEK